MTRRLRALCRALAAGGLLPVVAGAQLPVSSLAVEVAGEWREWWKSTSPPFQWREAHSVITSALQWRPAGDGLELAQLRLAGTGEAWRLRAIIVRIDPARIALRPAFGQGDSVGARSWRVDDALDAEIALNAGQFGGRRPWGWVVRDGRELLPPGSGSLASALVIDTDGTTRIVHAGQLAAVRGSGKVVHAFQSYPALLRDGGLVTNPLRAENRGVNLRHRDARLAIGIRRDSTVIVVLTRFEGLGGVLDVLPFGLTTPEIAALMGALGCTDAMLLDGGISGQLALRDNGETRSWPGLRAVPMGLIGRTR